MISTSKILRSPSKKVYAAADIFEFSTEGKFGMFHGQFQVSKNSVYKNVTFLSPYHYYVTEMASFFGDKDVLRKLLLASSLKMPQEMAKKKIISYKNRIKGYNFSTWESMRTAVMTRAFLLKLTDSSNEPIYKELIKNKSKLFVSIGNDIMWSHGRGSCLDKNNLTLVRNWYGSNEEGFALMSALFGAFQQKKASDGRKRFSKRNANYIYRQENPSSTKKWSQEGFFALKEE